jgi:hypothetical protein
MYKSLGSQNSSKLSTSRLLVRDQKSLSHTVWDCKYHLVRIPKYRKKGIFGELGKHLGPVFRELALQKES